MYVLNNIDHAHMIVIGTQFLIFSFYFTQICDNFIPREIFSSNVSMDEWNKLLITKIRSAKTPKAQQRLYTSTHLKQNTTPNSLWRNTNLVEILCGLSKERTKVQNTKTILDVRANDKNNN